MYPLGSNVGNEETAAISSFWWLSSLWNDFAELFLPAVQNSLKTKGMG
jgi:hypothetical protein